MDRRVSLRAALVVGLLAASGCQDYNFNPVGHCLIQPGTKRVSVSNISTADILFVVDDSGSMQTEQTNLAAQFDVFLTALQTANATRVKNGTSPIDFHIGITTTSVFKNPPVNGTVGGAVCRNDCVGASGSLVCCVGGSGGTRQPPQCRVDADCKVGYACKSSTVCSEAAAVGGHGCFDAACNPQAIACSTLDAECGNLNQYYSGLSTAGVEAWDTTCDKAYADDHFGTQDEYPMGRFMASSGTPVVLNFDKANYCTWDGTKCTDADLANPAVNTAQISSLSTHFKTNVKVGTCGSGQEQGLIAAKLATERVRAGTQSSGYVSGDFLHPNSKLVIIWVSDEDDCSSPVDPAKAVVFPNPPAPDGCVADASLPADQQRELSAAALADYFTSLGRPFGAAFIDSAPTGCQDASCTAIRCCDTTCDPSCSNTSFTCGGQGVPNRYVAFADTLRMRGVDVVSGSICDQFGGSLSRIAEIVKVPSGLTLPTIPASKDVTILRIVGSDGNTRKTCRGPAPSTMTKDQASAAGYDWWFTASDATVDPSVASKTLYINHATQGCEAGPGDTYAADYIGQLPPGGCSDPEGAPAPSCATALGGAATDWECVGYTTAGTGSCTCK
jgi:hypothetical protein